MALPYAASKSRLYPPVLLQQPSISFKMSYHLKPTHQSLKHTISRAAPAPVRRLQLPCGFRFEIGRVYTTLYTLERITNAAPGDLDLAPPQ